MHASTLLCKQPSIRTEQIKEAHLLQRLVCRLQAVSAVCARASKLRGASRYAGQCGELRASTILAHGSTCSLCWLHVEAL